MPVSRAQWNVLFAAQAGWMLDAMDAMLYAFALTTLQGVFGLRMRVVRLKLGAEAIELTEYLASPGRPIPSDWRSNDRWFQHVAIIVSDMDKAYRLLRQNRVRHASTGPQRLPDWNKNATGRPAPPFVGWKKRRAISMLPCASPSAAARFTAASGFPSMPRRPTLRRPPHPPTAS